MKYRRSILSSNPRARQFAREIVLASAITLAALVMFLVAREPTEIASMNEPVPSETGTVTGNN